MKKNSDLDFIKNVVNSSQVNAPNDINEQFVLDKLEGKKAEKIKMPVKKRIKIATASIVACVAAFAIFACAISNPSAFTEPKIAANAGIIQSFNDYDEIKAAIKKMQNSNELTGILNGGIISKDSVAAIDEEISTDTFNYDENYGETFKQVASVDEADCVKTDGKYIYYCSYYDDEIKVFNTDKINPTLVKTISLDSNNKTYMVYEMMLYNTNLIALCDSPYDSNEESATVLVYDISDIDNVKFVNQFAQSGSYSDSRMIDSTLYLISYQGVENSSDLPYVRCKTDKKAQQLAADDICTVSCPSKDAYLVVSKMDITSSNMDTQTKAILGVSGTVYCNEENLFITSTSYSEDKTQIVKIKLDDSIDFDAAGEVDGYINDQYSLDETDGMFRIATTSYDDSNDVNNLYVLDENLEVLGSVTGFAKDETIKAVRYVNDVAYVITYEQTDPLFVISLSNPSKPEILGEVKIDGFSSMLVPVENDKLLGIGYTDDGDFKLVLFDVSDSENPVVADTYFVKNSDSYVQLNPKALVYNSQRDCYTVPLNIYGNSTSDRGGELTFKIDGNKIDITGKYSSDKMYNCERCTYVGDNIYMLDGDTGIDTVAY